MNKHEFINRLLTRFMGTANEKKAQITADDLEKHLWPEIDFDDLDDKVANEWEKTTIPPIAWLKSKSKISADCPISSSKIWTIWGKDASGYEYDFSQAVQNKEEIKLEIAIMGLHQKGLEYVRNNIDEVFA